MATPEINEITVPSVREMVREQTLVPNIIRRHNTPDEIFDATELARLHRFVSDPASKDEILRDYDMVDAPGDNPGTGAQRHGSLAGFAIAHHGTGEPIMTDAQIDELRKWFDEGKRF